mmetsp:Transcript_39444/g.71066  ORF Transcript_39444/g.71066 Transcript_39444/m.71066 type:complete len:374 (-) Transcript_39444:1327-2448(-)
MRPSEEELLLLMIGEAILVCGNFRISVLTSTVVVCKRIDCHVLTDPKHTTVQFQQVREVDLIFTGQGIHNFPPVCNISVDADILCSVFRRIFSPPFLIHEVPWHNIQHICELRHVVVDGSIHSKHGDANLEELLQVLGVHFLNFLQFRVPVWQLVHVAGRAVIVWTEPARLRSYIADGTVELISWVVKHLWSGCIPASGSFSTAAAKLAATPTPAWHALALALRCLTWPCNVVHESVYDHTHTHCFTSLYHALQLFLCARARVETHGHRLVLCPPLGTKDVLRYWRDLHSINAIWPQVLLTLYCYVLEIPFKELHEDWGTKFFSVQSPVARLIGAEVAEDRGPLLFLKLLPLYECFWSLSFCCCFGTVQDKQL